MDEPPVQAGKVTAAVFAAVSAVIVKPPELRATATRAYEVYVAPKRSVAHVSSLTDDETLSLAVALKDVTIRFENLWRAPFPYVMALHQAPTDGGDYRPYHFYAAFHPPLRQPGLLKYLAGPEIGGGNFLSDSAPEAKAAELRALPPVHHSEK